jgi:hypothetical protein
VAASEWTWTAKFADLDLDGWLDLVITNGFVRDAMDADLADAYMKLEESGQHDKAVQLVLDQPALMNENLVLRNRGGRAFEDVSERWGFNTASIANGLALSDLDNDGDLDMVVNNMNRPAEVYRNNGTANRMAVHLRGTRSNHFGIGAALTATVGEQSQRRVMSVSGGYLSGHEPVVVFGLGDQQQVDRLTVAWPSGHYQEFGGLKANQAYTISEPNRAPPRPTAKVAVTTQFEELATKIGLEYVHVDPAFDDFARQSMLPWSLAYLGPGLAWGDADGDGWEDLYISGATGQPGKLFRNRDGRSFEAMPATQGLPAEPEELAALWWDTSDGNGPSLVVAHSSWELPGPAQAAGMWLANTRSSPGDLELAGEATELPSTPASPAALAAADLDLDGDADLFVGGRAVPGRYPEPAASALMSPGMTSQESTQTELSQLGLATGAVFSDVDGDRDPDLIVASEWGPIHMLRNDQGRLVEATRESGLEKLTGLWQGIASGDLDGDGDFDLVATNLGLNTRYHASPDGPAVLYYGDVDDNGSLDLIEAEYVDGELWPIRDRGPSGRQVPSLLQKFPTWLAFGQATLSEIYGDLSSARRLEATELAHSVFWNDGRARFTHERLPAEVQVMPGYGVAIADLDNDGYQDIYFVGNNSHAEPMTVAFDGGIGYWLRGGAERRFESVPVAASGLFVPEDGRGLAVADYDRDGWLDIAVGVNGGAVKLFHNRGVAGNSGLRVWLNGRPGNRSAVGAVVEVVRGDGSKLRQEVQAGSGYLSQNGRLLVFGLGRQAKVSGVTVLWPDGQQTLSEAPALDEILILNR